MDSRRSLLLQWHVTERCNLRCAHCYQDGTAAAERPLADLAAVLAQYKSLLDRLGARGHITLTGGEPFLREDFLDLLALVAAQKPRIGFAILTNGSLVDRALAARLRALAPSFVQVSMEGVPETHDRIRGEGDHARVEAAIRALVAEGVRALVSFTAHRMNFREFPEVARRARRLGAARVWADRLIPAGRGRGFESLTKEETRELIGLMRSARRRNGLAFWSRTEIPMHRALQFLGGGCSYRCTAGDSLITVQPDGTVLPCRRMPIPVGNLFERPLEELYFESPLLQALRDPARVSEGCRGCRYEPQCRGGLRCLAVAVAGSPFQADPGCWLAGGHGGRSR